MSLVNLSRTFLTVVFLACAMGTPLWADDGPITSKFQYQDPNPIPEDFAKRRNEHIAELKHQAVLSWLKNRLSQERFEDIEEQIDLKFTADKILDFRLNRVEQADGSHIQVEGHVDKEALEKWISLRRARADGDSIKPIIFLSSTLPGYELSPEQDPSNLSSNTFAQTVSGELALLLKRFNIRSYQLSRGGFPFDAPVSSQTQLSRLRDFGASRGLTSAIWAHFTPCTRCGGAKLVLNFYQLQTKKVPISQVHNLKISPSDMNSPERLKALLEEPLEQYQTSLEKLITTGVLYSESYKVSIENISSYKAYQLIQEELMNLRLVKQATISAAERNKLELDIKIESKETLEDLVRKLQNTSFSNFTLKPLRVDSRVVYVRYLSK